MPILKFQSHKLKVFIILIRGGLGNQMFGYAFFLEMKKRYPNAVILFKIANDVKQHQGLELFNIFNIKDKWRYKFCKPSLLWPLFHHIKQPNALVYDETLFNTHNRLNYFEGFWQSELYFSNAVNDVRRSFRFKSNIFNKETLSISKQIGSCNSVSIHIRRGDYLNFPDCAVCDVDYYNRAIAYIQKPIIDAVFFVFSDDISWCQENIKIDNAQYINFNIGKDSWQDMYLMSICKHNIIANSTFSWWGAYLNDNKQKIVIAPRKWFLNTDRTDIIPDKWIVI